MLGGSQQDFGDEMVQLPGNLFAAIARRADDTILVAFDASTSDIVWERNIKASIHDVTADAVGNLIIAGNYEDGSQLATSDPDVALSLPPLGCPDASFCDEGGYVASYSASGDLRWVQRSDAFSGGSLSLASAGPGVWLVAAAFTETFRVDEDGPTLTATPSDDMLGGNDPRDSIVVRLTEVSP